MKSNLVQETLISVILIILLTFFLNPFDFWMPSALVATLICSLVITFAVFASFIWKESARDEREAFHRMRAGRLAYLFGAGVLVLGIALQSYKHDLDLWLIFALAAMIVAKIVGLLYSRIKY